MIIGIGGGCDVRRAKSVVEWKIRIRIKIKIRKRIERKIESKRRMVWEA